VAGRRTQAQQRPDPGVDYSHFPSYAAAAGSTWYRNHRDRPETRDRGAWWFASSPESAATLDSGRFDLPEPFGTCYLASSSTGAVNEFIGPDIARRGWVESPLVESRVVSRVALPHDVRAANVSVAKAALFRVTGELATTADYDLTQDWARTFHRSGYGGIRHALRFTPGSTRGFAVFGDAGPRPRWRGDPDPEPMHDRLVEMGVEIVGIPSSAAVSLVDP
jgi:hypothetical protein